MNAIRATLQDGRIEPESPIPFPNGTPLLVQYQPLSEKIGLEESEWKDDAEALADWEQWLGSLEPIEFAEEISFDEAFRQFNIEAVRKQMESDPS